MKDTNDKGLHYHLFSLINSEEYFIFFLCAESNQEQELGTGDSELCLGDCNLEVKMTLTQLLGNAKSFV